MNKPNEVLAPPASPQPGGRLTDCTRGQRGLFLAAGVLVLVFSLPLYHLVRFALQNDLYSHIVLIPFISLYLIWIKRNTLPPSSPPARPWAIALFAAGTGLLAWRGGLALGGAALAKEDSLAFTTLAFVLFFGGICCWFLGRRTIRAGLFPLAFLIFMVPFPVALRTSLETILQHASAAVAYAFFKLSGMPIFREGLAFQLPGFSLEVAPQCSGIHSSLALFITSVLASHLFLRTTWKQVTLAAAVIPLALLRNGLRIFTVGTLCVRVGPEMINSYIHRHGGPVFFVLSLVPFFLLLLLLVKSERPARRAPESAKG